MNLLYFPKARIDGFPVNDLHIGINVLRPSRGEVKEVGVLVDVHCQKQCVIPDWECVLSVADVIEDSAFLVIVG